MKPSGAATMPRLRVRPPTSHATSVSCVTCSTGRTPATTTALPTIAVAASASAGGSATVVVCVGSKTADAWSFYIFSACGSANKLLFRDFDLELVQEFRVFGHLLAQQGDEIQAGGPMRLPAPLGQGFISGPALCAESH